MSTAISLLPPLCLYGRPYGELYLNSRGVSEETAANLDCKRVRGLSIYYALGGMFRLYLKATNKHHENTCRKGTCIYDKMLCVA